MLSESLRRRLETLNREQLPASKGIAPAIAKRPQPTPVPKATKPTKQSPLLPTGEVVANDAGEHLLISVPVEKLWPTGPGLVAARHEHLLSLQQAQVMSETSPAGQPSPKKLSPQVIDMPRLLDAFPQRCVMLDLETCGLGGASIFLTGLLRSVDQVLTVELLLARTYAEEQAMLESLWQRVAETDVLVTYNGKSFDWPTVLDRSRRHLIHRRRTLAAPHHVDMLHHARRRWKGHLPDCKLQTIERQVCRRRRTGDIPGSQIPAAYDQFVRTGQTGEMEAILSHNAIDLVTLLDITMRLADVPQATAKRRSA